MDRIGIYGGTFNPIHYGHLRTAWEVKEAFNLSTVFFIPAALPPHKKGGQIETPEDRMEMIQRAIENLQGFQVSDLELLRPGLSYTIDTVKQFKAPGGGQDAIHFIIGSDAFLDIHTWKSFRDLFTLVSFIVMVRPDPKPEGPEARVRGLGDYLRQSVSSDFVYDSKGKCFLHPGMMPVHILHVTPLAISSTDIRRMIREGKSPRFLVPEGVLSYIQSKGLYQ